MVCCGCQCLGNFLYFTSNQKGGDILHWTWRLKVLSLGNLQDTQPKTRKLQQVCWQQADIRMRSHGLQQLVASGQFYRLVATCHLQTCCNLLKQLVMWITRTSLHEDNADNLHQVCWQLATDLLSTSCSKPGERILISACCQQTCCNLRRFWLCRNVPTTEARNVAEKSCFISQTVETQVSYPIRGLLWTTCLMIFYSV